MQRTPPRTDAVDSTPLLYHVWRAPFDPLLHALTSLVLRRPGSILLVALVTTLPMGYWSGKLFGDVRADIKELLPNSASSVRTLRELERRFGGWSQLTVVIESPDRGANRRFSDDIVHELSGLETVRSIRNKLGAEREFFQKKRSLYVDLEDLEEIYGRLEDAAHQAKVRANPLLVDMEGDNGPVEFDISDIEKKYASRLGILQQFPNDYFENKEGTELAVLIRQRGLAFGIARNKRLVASVEGAIAKLDPARYHPSMRVGLAGDVANLVAEQASLLEDLVTASIIVAILLALVVVAYYRRVRAVMFLAVPVLVGTTFTFGISHFLVGYLNASSAFLGPIIPGNGINFGLILLARYIEERRGDRSIDDSVSIAVRETAKATSLASLAASIAYGSLMATDFLGFKHFGVIGGIGMVLCWLATFTVLPALIVWVERRWPLDASREIKLYPPGTLAALPARAIRASPHLVAWSGALLGFAAALVTLLYLRDPLEKDFHKLRSTFTQERGPEYWERKVRAMFGRSVIPQVIIAEKHEDVPHIVTHLEKVIRDGGELGPITDVTALSKLIPDHQEEKIAVLGKIRNILSDDLLANLGDEERRRASELKPPSDLSPFTAEDLPESIRSDFRELDGREGLVVLVGPNVKLNGYHADVIRRIAETMRSIPLPDGRMVESSGNYVIYTDMLDAVARDGPRATLYSFLGVILLCFVAYRRPSRVLVVTSSLLVGVAWLGALLATTELKINFLNFIALPITFGIGVDYSVNTYTRYVLERRSKPPAQAVYDTIVSTGGAVVLCSLTTIIGYASLLIAHNGALISFGRVAILGEFTTLAAAILIMPAWLVAWSRSTEDTRSAAPEHAPPRAGRM